MDKELIKQRILSNIEIKPSPDGRFQDCWWWNGAKNKKSGYGVIRTEYKNYYVHRLSMFAWNDFKLDSKLLVCHKCDNHRCGNHEHLFVGTYQDNQNDCKNKGRQCRGGKNRGAKLTELQVIEIRRLFEEGIDLWTLALKFNVEHKTIKRIILVHSWSHI